MTDSRVASLAALLRDFEEFLREELSLPRFREAQSHLAGIRNVTAHLGEPSPEPIDLLATAVGALADVDVVHLTETWTDRDGCFYGGIPEWRASLLGHLRERFAALRPDGFGVRAGSEETP